MSDSVYNARKNFVIIRKQKRELIGSLIMPDSSNEAFDYVVENVSPDVKDLKKGDLVTLLGSNGQEWGYIPGESNLIVTDERLIPYVITR